jgi:uncharacterized protein (TIGR03435 family)
MPKLRVSTTIKHPAIAIVAGIALLSAATAWPQAPAARPEVEVAVIRPSTETTEAGYFRLTPGRFSAHNLPVRRLIYVAYKIKADQIVGGPAWINSDRYDITATAEDVSGNNFPLMLQKLLEDRFHLKLHPETKDGPVYELAVAKSGLKMQPTKPGTCVQHSLSRDRPAQEAGQKYCGMWQEIGAGVRTGTESASPKLPELVFRALSDSFPSPWTVPFSTEPASPEPST